MDLTESQVNRQLLRIRDALFSKFEVLVDNEEAYKGELNLDVKVIIDKHIQLDKVLTEEEFQSMFANCVGELITWVMENTEGVDKEVAAIFCVDLLEQTLSRIYSVEEIDNQDNYMYG